MSQIIALALRCSERTQMPGNTFYVEPLPYQGGVRFTIQVRGWLRDVSVKPSFFPAGISDEDAVAHVRANADEIFVLAREAADLKPVGTIIISGD